MARKSLSSQVIEEVDRARGLLAPIQDITDPMTSHLVGAVLESLRRVETLCLNAMQASMDAVLAGNPIATVDRAEDTRDKPVPRRSTSHKPRSAKKAI